MSFPYSVASRALLDCARSCCICHKFCGTKIELHHISSKAEGGEDTYENCIPLCFDCHADVRAYDPKHPKGRKYTEAELLGHRDRWYEAVRLKRSGSTKLECTELGKQGHNGPLVSRISLSGSSLWTRSADKSNSERVFDGPRGHNFLWEDGIRLDFDITNPNEIDMRIVGFYVVLIEYVDVDVMDVWTRGIGGGLRTRFFDCELTSRTGVHECRKVSEDFDFIRLSFGEMEFFSVEVKASTEGLYRIKLGIRYSIGGDVSTMEKDDDVVDLLFFDLKDCQIRRTHDPLKESERM